MDKEYSAMSEKPLHRGRGGGGSSLSQSSHLSPHTVQHLLDTLAEEVAQALARGESYTIPGVGTFTVAQRKPRPYADLNNPGQQLVSQPYTAIKFRPAHTLLVTLNALDPDSRYKVPGRSPRKRK